MRLMGALCGISCLWLALACSGGTSKNDVSAGGGASVGQSTPLTDYVHLSAASTCVRLERCLNGAATALGDCTEALELALREQVATVIDRAVQDGRIVYDSNDLAGCLTAVEKASCDEVLFDECRSVFRGTKKTGESCVLDLECADQQQCVVSDSCPGSCAPAGMGGEACSTHNSCAPGFACASDVCVKTAKLGEACGRDVKCQGYGFCSGFDTTTPDDTGTCVARSELATSGQDEPCEPFSEPLCKAGFVCTTKLEGDIVVGSCQKPVASGAACTYSTPDPCPRGEYCSITSAVGVKPATGACRATLKVGETCMFDGARVGACESGAKCDVESKLCVATSHLDGPCTNDAGCYSDTCVDGKCVPRLECEESERAITSSK